MSEKRYMGEKVTGRRAIAPQALSGGVDQFGQSIDRLRFGSAKIHVANGAVTGGPSAVSVVTRLQDSDDGASFADFVDPVSGNVVTLADADAADAESELALNLLAARRYIRTATDVVLTGGSSPTVFVSQTIVLAGADIEPAS